MPSSGIKSPTFGFVKSNYEKVQMQKRLTWKSTPFVYYSMLQKFNCKTLTRESKQHRFDCHIQLRKCPKAKLGNQTINVWFPIKPQSQTCTSAKTTSSGNKPETIWLPCPNAKMQKAFDFQNNCKNEQMQKWGVLESYRGRHRPICMFFTKKNTNIRNRACLILFGISKCRICFTNCKDFFRIITNKFYRRKKIPKIFWNTNCAD